MTFLYIFIDNSVYTVYIIIYTVLTKEVGLLKILISNKSDLPIYEQIKVQIKEQILSGNIPENEFLPSIRQLAKELLVIGAITESESDLIIRKADVL